MKNENATDWDRYYGTVPATAKVTRRITTAILLSLMRRHGLEKSSSIVELGGANSCFYEAVNAAFAPASYVVVDTNAKGLDMFRRRFGTFPGASGVLGDVLAIDSRAVPPADLVYSVGLVEHFDVSGTGAAIRSHFELAKPGGLVLITFPTPTLSYRAARAALEKIGRWDFPDERPLLFKEVRSAVEGLGTILEERTSNAIILSQGIIVARKLSLQ